jgi:exodeoxyribonuclease-5
MVDTRLLNDMQSFGQPIIAIGDPGQLEPVGKDPRLMHTPDIVLDQIHRQAEGSGIIQFATAVRKDYFCPGDQFPDVSFIDGRPLVADLKWADIVLCGFNRTRGTINSFCRKLRGFNSILEDGEQIIILKNNYHFSVFNGQIVTVKKVLGRQGSFIKAHCDIDGLERELRFFEPQFGSDKEHRIDSRDGVIADYGYCITCHKSQGSEWDNVLVIDEQCNKWEPRRWRYTAITRAAIELRYCWKNKG